MSKGDSTDAHKGLPYYTALVWATPTVFSRVSPCGRPWNSPHVNALQLLGELDDTTDVFARKQVRVGFVHLIERVHLCNHLIQFDFSYVI